MKKTDRKHAERIRQHWRDLAIALIGMLDELKAVNDHVGDNQLRHWCEQHGFSIDGIVALAQSIEHQAAVLRARPKGGERAPHEPKAAAASLQPETALIETRK